MSTVCFHYIFRKGKTNVQWWQSDIGLTGGSEELTIKGHEGTFWTDENVYVNFTIMY